MIISTCQFSEIAKFCGNSQSIARYTQMNTKIFKTRPSQLRSVSNLQRCKIGHTKNDRSILCEKSGIS